RLGWVGLRTTASGMALVRDGAISFGNARWHELDRPGDGLGWERLKTSAAARTQRGLSELALKQAKRLLARSASRWSVIRCRCAGIDQVVELRAEKMAGGRGMGVGLAYGLPPRLR